MTQLVVLAPNPHVEQSCAGTPFPNVALPHLTQESAPVPNAQPPHNVAATPPLNVLFPHLMHEVLPAPNPQLLQSTAWLLIPAPSIRILCIFEPM